MRKRITPIIVGVVCIISASRVIGGALHLELVPETTLSTIGDVIEVDVRITGLGEGGAPSVGAYDMDVDFDVASLSFSGVDFGTFLGDPLALPFPEVLTDFTVAGDVVDFAAVSLLSPSELDALQPSTFSLATLSFTGIADSVVTFEFVGEIRVDDAFGNKLVIPEPATLTLLGLGIVGIAYRRRKLIKRVNS